MTQPTIYLPGDTLPDPLPARSIRLVVIGAVSDTTAPTIPGSLTATAGNAQIVYGWAASSDAVGVTGYRIRRGGTLIASPTGTTYTLTGLTNGTAVSNVTVAAVDAAGNESAQATFPAATPSGVQTAWTTTFTNSTVGGAVTDFVGTKWVSGLVLDIVADASAPSGKALRIVSPATSGRRIVTYTPPGSSVADAELVVLWKWTTPGTEGGAVPMARVSGAATTETGVGVGKRTTGDIYGPVYNGGAFTGLGSEVVEAALGQDVWGYTRTRINGTTANGRTWLRGDAEPGTWDVTYSITNPTTAGDVGILIASGGDTVHVGGFSVNVAGGTATLPS